MDSGKQEDRQYWMRDCVCREFVDLGTQEAICLGVDKIIMAIKGIWKVEAFKVRSHGTATVAATARSTIGFHSVWQWQQQSDILCNVPLLLLHRMGLEPIYLQHHCRSRCRKCSYERLHLVQWNPIDNVAVAAAAAAPCERTLNARLVDLPTFIPLLFDCLCQRFLICHLMLFALLCLWDYFHYPQIPRLLPDSSGQQQCKNTFYWAKPWRTWMEKIMKDHRQIHNILDG